MMARLLNEYRATMAEADSRSPAPREPRNGGLWEMVRSALETNPRTFRLCLILFVAKVVSPGMTAVVAELVRHMLLCGARVVGPALGRGCPASLRAGTGNRASPGGRPRLSAC